MLTKSVFIRHAFVWFILFMLCMSVLGLPGAAFAQGLGIQSDLGDAPDSTNSTSTPMLAYPGVNGNFPTVFDGPAPYGPKHVNASLKFYLGGAISGEDEADAGYDADADGGNNLFIPAGLADRDGSDDGFTFGESMLHCQTTRLAFTVTVADSSVPMFLNLWLDWNRSGIWGDATSLACPGASPDEWAVRNFTVTVSAPGQYTFVTPAFLVWNPVGGEPMWVRATLSEAAETSADGSGPRAGYQFGETEDYLVRAYHRVFLPTLQGGSAIEEPEPEPAEPTGEFDEPQDVRAAWSQVPHDDSSGVVEVDDLTLDLIEQVGVSRESVSVEWTIIAGGRRIVHTTPVSRLPMSGTVSLALALSELGVDPAALAAPGRIEARVIATDTQGQAYHGVSDSIFFHADERNAKQMVVYGQAAATRQFSALALDHSPIRSSRLATLLPADLDRTDLAEIGVFDSSDPILREPPVDPVDDEAGPPAEPIAPTALQLSAASADAALADYVICLRMWVAPQDSNQADLGQTGWWKGRGAHVIIYHDGQKMWDGWLNIHGCMTLSSNRTGPIVVSYQGEHKLRSGSRSMQLDIMPGDASNAGFSHVKGTAIIQNPTASGVNVAPLTGFSSMGMLAYAIQERVWHNGLDGDRLWVKLIGCNDQPGAGACSSTKAGKDILFLDTSNQSHRQKFIIMHEFGHALLKLTTSGWKQDCSFGTGGPTFHTRKGLEYSSCAAGEGWAHFIGTLAWNLVEGENPDGVWNGWDVENGGVDTALCYQQNQRNCDGWGVELDWMRHLWDYFTNNRPTDVGSRPTLVHMVALYGDTSWKNGEIHSSKRIEQNLSGAMLQRWIGFACYNGIRECK